MAEAKTIKRRGFLKALPLAGMAVATPAVAAVAQAQSQEPEDIKTLGRRLANLMSEMHDGQRFAVSIDHEHGFVLINRIHDEEKRARA